MSCVCQHGDILLCLTLDLGLCNTPQYLLEDAGNLYRDFLFENRNMTVRSYLKLVVNNVMYSQSSALSTQ